MHDTIGGEEPGGAAGRACTEGIQSLEHLDAILDGLDLQQAVQDIYDETRSLAQQARWEDHLRRAAPLLVSFRYLQQPRWISRILGRMAWSYIRLHRLREARRFLAVAEEFDRWQAAANYFWASEYALRSDQANWSQEFTQQFKRVCERDLGLSAHNDITLAVLFYEKLVSQEASDPLFVQANNQSDLGRYMELRGRLTSAPGDFLEAARHYDLAGLQAYAAVSRAFYHISLAGRAESVRVSQGAYRGALATIDHGPFFGASNTRDLLRSYLETRIACCEIAISIEDSQDDPSCIPGVEAGYSEVFRLIRGNGEGDEQAMTTLVSRFVSVSATHAWKQLLDFVDGLDAVVCSTEAATASKLADHLDAIQPYLPSLSFLASR